MKKHEIVINKPSKYDGQTDIFVDGKRADGCIKYSIREEVNKPLWIDITFRYLIDNLKVNSEVTEKITDTIEFIDDINKIDSYDR